jgi:hypothetical protein
MNVHLAKLSGGTTVIPGEMLDGLKPRIRGTILTERDDGYIAARSVWNAMIDRRPAIIVQCAGAGSTEVAIVELAELLGRFQCRSPGDSNTRRDVVSVLMKGSRVVDNKRINSKAVLWHIAHFAVLDPY